MVEEVREGLGLDWIRAARGGGHGGRGEDGELLELNLEARRGSRWLVRRMVRRDEVGEG